jgi:hypothetical protein
MAAAVSLEPIDTQIDPTLTIRDFPLAFNIFNIPNSASFDAFTPANIPQGVFTPADHIGMLNHTNIPPNSKLSLNGDILTFGAKIGSGIDGNVYEATFNGKLYCIKVSNYDNDNRFREILGEFIIQTIIHNATKQDNHYDCPYTPECYGILNFSIYGINVTGIIQELIPNSMTLDTWIQTRPTGSIDSVTGQTFNKDIIRITRRLQNLWRLYSFNHADLHTKNILIIHDGDTNKHTSARLIDFGHSLFKLTSKMIKNVPTITTPKEGRDLTHLTSFLKYRYSGFPYINNNAIVNYIYTPEIKAALEEQMRGEVNRHGNPKPTFFGAYRYFNINDNPRAYPSAILNMFNTPANGGPIGDVRESCGKAPIAAVVPPVLADVPLRAAVRPPLPPTASGSVLPSRNYAQELIAAQLRAPAASASPVANTVSGISGTIAVRPINTRRIEMLRAVDEYERQIKSLYESSTSKALTEQINKINTVAERIENIICGTGNKCLYSNNTGHFLSLPSDAKKAAIAESIRLYERIEKAENEILGVKMRGLSARKGGKLKDMYNNEIKRLQSEGLGLIFSVPETETDMRDRINSLRGSLREYYYNDDFVKRLINRAIAQNKEIDDKLKGAIARVERWWNPRKEKRGENWDEAVRLAQTTSSNMNHDMAQLILALQEEWASENRQAAAAAEEARRAAAAEEEARRAAAAEEARRAAAAEEEARRAAAAAEWEAIQNQTRKEESKSTLQSLPFFGRFFGGGVKPVNINTNNYTLSITINNTKGLLIAPFLYFGGIKTTEGGRFKKYNKSRKRKLKGGRTVVATPRMPVNSLYTNNNPTFSKSHKTTNTRRREKLMKRPLQQSVNSKRMNTMVNKQSAMNIKVTTEGIMNTSAEDILQYIRFTAFSNINSDVLNPLIYSLTSIPLREKSIAEDLTNVINTSSLEELKGFVDKYSVSNMDEKLINKNWPRNIKDMKTAIDLYMSEETPETARKLLRFLIYADFDSKENYNAFITWFKSSPPGVRAEIGDYYTNAIVI